MKVLLLFLLLSVLVLSACGGGEAEILPDTGDILQDMENSIINDSSDAAGELPDTDDSAQPDETPAIEDSQGPGVFSFKMNDVVIEMNQNIDYVIDRLGEPRGVFEAPSCAFDGIDRIFSYPGIQIYTYPKGDSDFIHTIGFLDDTVRTSEGGIRLGSKLQAVLDAYGDDYEFDTGMYKFTRGLTSLEFLVDDDMVTGISYGFRIEQ